MRDLKRAEDRAVDQVIAMQEGTGVDVVTDGEMRRFLFMGPITETVEGIELVEHDSAMPWSTPEGDVEWTSPAAVTSKLRKVRSMVTEEYSYARARARLPLKVTVPSPLVLYGFWSPRHSTAAYKDAFAMFADAAEVGRSEIQELVSLGCEYIQVDAPELATLVDPRVRDWAEGLGFGAERMLTEGIDLINAMVEGISGVRLGIHLCRGNNAGMWMASGGYDYIAQALFERATAFDAYFLEYDDARSGSFEPLAAAPDDKQVVLGLVSTKTPALETPQELERPHRRGRARRRPRPARSVDAVRLRLDRRGQPDHRGRRGVQAAPGGGHRPRRVGLTLDGRPGSGGRSGFVQESRATLAAMTNLPDAGGAGGARRMRAPRGGGRCTSRCPLTPCPRSSPATSARATPRRTTITSSTASPPSRSRSAPSRSPGFRPARRRAKKSPEPGARPSPTSRRRSLGCSRASPSPSRSPRSATA